MKIFELKQKINELESRQVEISAMDELTDEVKKEFDNIQDEKRALKDELRIKEVAENINLSNPVVETKPEKEEKTFNEIFGEYLRTGQAPKEYARDGGFHIPASMLRGVTDTTAVGDATKKEVEPGIDIAISPAQSLLTQLGVNYKVRVMGSGDYVLPSAPQPTGGFVAEGVAVADASMSLSNLTLSPRRNGMISYHSIEAEAVTDPAVQNDIVQALVDSIWEDVAKDLFDQLETDAVDASTTQLATNMSAKDLTELQANVPYMLANARYATTPSIAAKLKHTATVASIAGPVWTGAILDGEVDGIPAVGTPFANDDTLYYGDFSKATVAQWGGITIQANPFEKDAEGQIKVVARGLFDTGVANYRYFSWIPDVSLA